MRFSAVEEDGYEVAGLGQENVASDAAESMTSAAEILPNDKAMVDESSMTYNLPLLFASGYPTSLDKISLTELERFITFMVECSSDPLLTGAIIPPQWWPNQVKFSIPIVRPKKIDDNWMETLKELVLGCYAHYKSEYLLQFCSYLAQYPREKLYYVNNWDSTTSLYHKGTGKLLATFRNENMDYDKIVDSPRRSLLPQNHATSKCSSKSNKPKEQKQRTEAESSLVVIQPPLEEIYLCDNCDAEFGDLDQMKDHEKICGEPVQNIISRPVTPYSESIIEPELNQNQFLDYLKLSTSSVPPPTLATSESSVIACEPVRSTRRLRTAVNLNRCPTIPLSSPAGLIMVKKSKTMTESIQQERLDRLERQLTAPPLNKFSRPKWLDRLVVYNRWIVSYKPNREKPVQDDYVHKYTFGAIKRYKTVLSLKSQLLYVACGTCYVKLQLLSADKLQDLKNHPWKYSPPVPRIMPPRPRPGPLSKLKQPVQLAIKRKNSADLNGQSCSVETKRTKAAPALLVETVEPILPKLLQTCQLDFAHQRRSEPVKTIVLVDLCSSDDDAEEDTNNPVVQSDENRDPMSISGGGGGNAPRTNFPKNMSLNPSNCRSRSLGYQGSTVSDWMRQGTLTKENRKNTSPAKYLDTTFTSVLKPAP